MMRVECHIFSGLLGVGAGNGTQVIERLIDDLPAEVDAHHHLHTRWRKVLDGIIKRHNSLGKAKIILIGHSYGAKRCQQIAKKLDSNNIEVEYVAGIDPTALFAWQPKMKLTSNINLIDEFHATSGIPHSARKSDPSGRSGGMFIIPNDLDDAYTKITVPGPHIRCPASKITRERILEKVKTLIT